MKKYERKVKVVQDNPKKINDFMFDLLLHDFKLSFIEEHKFLKFEELNTDLCLTIILYEFHAYPSKTKEYLKKRVLNRIKKRYLYYYFIKISCNNLRAKDFNRLEDILKSFVSVGLVKDAKKVERDKQSFIEIILPNNKKIRYSDILFLEKKLIDECRGSCHWYAENFMKYSKKRGNLKVAIILQNNGLYGKYYHSIIIEDDIVYDFAHNILMSYDNYLDLIKPKILVYESYEETIKNITKLNSDKNFKDADFDELLKYGVYKQMKGKC